MGICTKFIKRLLVGYSEEDKPIPLENLVLFDLCRATGEWSFGLNDKSRKVVFSKGAKKLIKAIQTFERGDDPIAYLTLNALFPKKDFEALLLAWGLNYSGKLGNVSCYTAEKDKLNLNLSYSFCKRVMEEYQSERR